MAANSQFTVAVHALCWIELAARQGETPITSERVAESLASNPVLVRRLLGPLRDAGILTTSRGPGAGWSLARPTDEVTLLDVYDALGHEGPFGLHPHDPKPDCPVGHGIRPTLSGLYRELDEVMSRELAGHTVAGVLEELLAEHPLPRRRVRTRPLADRAGA